MRQRLAGVSAGQAQQVVLGASSQGDGAGQAALVGDRPPHEATRRRPSASGCSVSSRERDSSGEFTENDGFSVVAATSVTQRFSTLGSSASCCALVKRCTSSMNSTVSARRSRARGARPR